MPGIEAWLQSPSGRYLFEWECARMDLVVSDIFGFNAVQVGLSDFDFLRNNRMPSRIRCDLPGSANVGLFCDAWALPFATASIDLVVLPHVLEFSPHPHQVLREVERVLMPEGSVVVSGLNPFSLWGLRRYAARKGGDLPWKGQYLSVRRLKDWLALLGMEIQAGGFGCHAPPMKDEKWLRRFAFVDRAGARWWPFAGGAYVIQAVKRVQGMRLITPNWRDRRATAKALSPVVQKHHKESGKRE